MFIQVALDGRLPVGKGGGGVIAATVLPRIEREEVDVCVANIHKGVVDGGKLEEETVLGEEIVHLVCGGIFTHRDVVVRRHLGGLLDVWLERHRCGGQGPERERRQGSRMRQLTWEDC